ncbi:hypothetical protein Tco_0548846 [Tanacetum coccineum]
MLAMPSPRSVNNTFSWIWCRASCWIRVAAMAGVSNRMLRLRDNVWCRCAGILAEHLVLDQVCSHGWDSTWGFVVNMLVFFSVISIAESVFMVSYLVAEVCGCWYVGMVSSSVLRLQPMFRPIMLIFSCYIFVGCRVNHYTSVSRPQLKSYQVKDKVVSNNSQVKFNHKEVEKHHKISSISRKTKSVTTCNDSSKSRTLNVNDVCAECGKCVFNSNHDACVSRYLNDKNARTKKPKVVPISASKPKRKANKSVATPHKKTVASDTTIQKSKCYYKELYENTNHEWKWWIAKKCPSGY